MLDDEVLVPEVLVPEVLVPEVLVFESPLSESPLSEDRRIMMHPQRLQYFQMHRRVRHGPLG